MKIKIIKNLKNVRIKMRMKIIRECKFCEYKKNLRIKRKDKNHKRIKKM